MYSSPRLDGNAFSMLETKAAHGKLNMETYLSLLSAIITSWAIHSAQAKIKVCIFIWHQPWCDARTSTLLDGVPLRPCMCGDTNWRKLRSEPYLRCRKNSYFTTQISTNLPPFVRWGIWRFLQGLFGFGNIYTSIKYTSMRCTPMRYTPMRCTPMRYACEVHALEMHAHEVHACEMHVYKGTYP